MTSKIYQNLKKHISRIQAQMTLFARNVWCLLALAINCLISWHWKLQKVTGNSTLRTYEKFGNTLFNGLRGGGGGVGWLAPILVRKGNYFLILCKNYSKLLITVIMAKTVLRSPVNR